MIHAANAAIARCRWIASQSESPANTTRTFLSPPMREVHQNLRSWMESCGMSVHIDNAGNLRGTIGDGPRLILASHLDTVPDAGAFDGILGVVLAITLVEVLGDRKLPYTLEVVGFSEEEGVRFGIPFIGSRALIGDAADLLAFTDPQGISVANAIRDYGLDPDQITDAKTDAAAYLEFHIEQGPVLESLGLPLAVVDAIAGQSRLDLTFTGHSNHAGTTPMHLRRDALAAAAEWVCQVEKAALSTPGLVATVGHIEASPNARNAINGHVLASLDLRHAEDSIRLANVERHLLEAQSIAARRNLSLSYKQNLDQAAVQMDANLAKALADAVTSTGHALHRITSGAGHDAMIVARRIPAAMLFLRSPGGISHHPDENVIVEDVAAALEAGMHFLLNWKPPLV
jgi:allantoate deiminase